MERIENESTEHKGISLILERLAGVAILLGMLAFACGFNWLRMAEAVAVAMLLSLARLAYSAAKRHRELRHRAAKAALPHSRLLR